MATERTVTTGAEAKVMTLGELRRFVREMDDAGAVEATPIGAKITWRGGLQQLQAKVIHFTVRPSAQARRLQRQPDGRITRVEGNGQ